ncbi:MAG: UDP-N-acetylglucosamine 1-carboxyvinyltransferase [Planctomycetes bacterium]|nr:UDP-N-acetylglucosamine 1-carboxyvinyltransferase [Planctomycetota bacterium]
MEAMDDMDELVVEGGSPLKGSVEVRGAKNVVTKLMVASMLTDEPCIFSNVPSIGDGRLTQAICQSMGMRCRQSSEHVLAVQTSDIIRSDVPAEYAGSNRLAIMLLGPLLHRKGRAVIPAVSGGDRIGPRPVDFHLEGYRMMGANIEVRDQAYLVRAPQRLKGTEIILPYPSVTTTENLLIAAVLAEGKTFIRNAAIEPEVMDLIMFLQKMGAIIDYNVDRTLAIEGVKSLGGTKHEIMPDRIVAASLGAAAIATGGDIFVKGARQADMSTFLNALRRIGGGFDVESDGIRFYRQGELKSITLETNVHPGFMTDWQPPFVILLTQAHGISVVHETVFEDRFGYVKELQRMGADVGLYDTCLGRLPCRFASSNYKHSCVIKGPTRLHGADVSIPDLRAGFTYLIAAILAEGTSVIDGVHHLDRGYESIDKTLCALGAKITRRCGSYASESSAVTAKQ